MTAEQTINGGIKKTFSALKEGFRLNLTPAHIVLGVLAITAPIAVNSIIDTTNETYWGKEILIGIREYLGTQLHVTGKVLDCKIDQYLLLNATTKPLPKITSSGPLCED